MSRGALAARVRRAASYWPHATAGLGISLSMAAALVDSPGLGVVGTNMVIVAGVFLEQRRRNGSRDS